MTRTFDADSFVVRAAIRSFALWQIVVSRFKQIVLSDSADWAEFQQGVMFIAWGGWLLALDITAGRFVRSSVWDVLSEVAPLTFWGVGLAMMGLATLCAVLLGNIPARRWLALFGFVWWTQLFLICAKSATLDAVLTLPTTAVFALSSAWCHVRLVRQEALANHLTYRGK